MAPNPSALRAPVPAHERGLTLVEMIVVLAIIALVAALIVPNVIGRPDQARVTTTQADLRSMSAALKTYRLDNGDYPSTAQGLAALVTKPTGDPVPQNWQAGGYLERLPADGWGRPYAYRSPGENGAGFELVSLGRDGKPGGEDTSADITLTGN
jgi:general secretion pathway protein G